MASLDEVITIPRLRDGVGGVGDSEDVILTQYRAAAISRIEGMTGRCLVDRTSVTTPFDCRYIRLGRGYSAFDALAFAVSDVKPDSDLTFHYSELSGSSVPKGKTDRTETLTPSGESRIDLQTRTLMLYPPADDRWSDTITLVAPVPRLTCRRGMSAADIPEEFGAATILLVRAIYEGSAYDSFEKNSAVSMLLAGHKPRFVGEVVPETIGYSRGFM